MLTFAIAFVLPDDNCQLRHRVLEAPDEEAALRKFFSEEALTHYSDDEQGFYYFKEDFFDEKHRQGSIIRHE